MSDPVLEFQAAMENAGLAHAKTIIADGKIHRFKPVGEKSGSNPGWYIFHADSPPSGAFGSWKTGERHTWTIEREDKMTEVQRMELRERIEADRKAREAELERVQQAAREKSLRLWEAAHDPVPDHAYFTTKNILPPKGVRQLRDMILIPMRDSRGVLHSIQFIKPDGTKRFTTGGMVEGCYFTMLKPDERGLIVCEGFATGVTIAHATGRAVAVAFTAGNLERVARALREKFPNMPMLIACDNDRWTKPTPEHPKIIENPGRHFGHIAAAAVGGMVVMPEFSSLEEKPTDFNDLMNVDGLARVKEIVSKPLKPAPSGSAPATAEVMDPTPPSGEVVRLIPSEDEIMAALPHNHKGKPLATIDNLKELCRRLRVVLRYNVISKDEEILAPGEVFSIDNRANASLAWLFSWAARLRMPTDKVGDFVTYLADQNPYNPVAQWIDSKPWDGVSRIGELCATVTVKGEERPETADGVRSMKELLIMRWLISAVAACFNPGGVSAHGVLVFQGAQYLGKTMWFKRLVPESLSYLIAEGRTLRPDDRDSVKQAVSFWLVELGELDATFRKADIAQLKSFITRDKDVFRRAYARRESEYARRTVFFASVNPEEFLHDTTGNRRFWALACVGINHGHSIDMQQLWAEVKSLWAMGESWFLSNQELALLNEQNKAFEVGDPIDELIACGLRWNDDLGFGWTWRTATAVLHDLGYQRPTQKELNRAGATIRRLNGGQAKRANVGVLFNVPPICKT